MPRPPIAIIGAGISGLTLARCLRRRNIPAIVYERVKDNPTRNNYGITLRHDTWKSLLEPLQIDERDFKRQLGVRHPKTDAVVEDDGALRVNRAALTRVLQEGVDVKWEHKSIDLSATNDTRSAKFDRNGSSEAIEYGLLVAADGVHSATRSALKLKQSDFEMKTLPYVVFNGKRRIKPLSQVPESLLTAFEKPDGIVHRHGQVALSIKGDFWDSEKDSVAISYTLSRPAKDGDKPLIERNISDAEKLAAQFKDEVAALKDLPPPFDAVFNKDQMIGDRLLHWLMRSSLVDSDALQKSASTQGVLLLGDAAHAQPIPGYGANTAIADAIELARHISPDGKIDIAKFLQARAESWAGDKESAEQDLSNLHNAGTSQSML
ncbi:hypothetical protein B0A48_15866 [Cryoendolithus antarcticus]|uniref:FAD-binding domain-containing protein n=1 Tax=Cryoendolithus antarcticus TaxID=1507870 RepID=A0A1V8SHN7_9PEZI|nr:hypothetical protein B0A48_15866 [Cryoendolithus antarcticus]